MVLSRDVDGQDVAFQSAQLGANGIYYDEAGDPVARFVNGQLVIDPNAIQMDSAEGAGSADDNQALAVGDTRANPPPGSKGIDETEWSGDHTGIKGAVDAGGDDNVKISPDGDVWVRIRMERGRTKDRQPIIRRVENLLADGEKTVTDESDDFEDEHYRYQVRLSIRHPTKRLDEMSSLLNCEATSGWSVGDRIGRGNNLRRFSAWRLEREFEDRAFFKGVKGLCEWAMPRREAIRTLQVEGSRTTILVNLRGQYNIGDTLDCETMRMASELNIPISVEVFPDTNW